MPTEVAGDSSGLQAVGMLYSNSSQASSFDRASVLSQTETWFSYHNMPGPNTLNLIVPEGFRNQLSVDTKTQALVCMNYLGNGAGSCDFPYKGSIKALVKKIPGFFFSSYRQISFAGSVITSNRDYRTLLQDQFAAQSDNRMRLAFEDLISSYNFTYDVPKDFLFVRLKPDLPQYRREFIANGLRSYLRDDLSVVFDLKDLQASVQSSLDLFSLFSIIVGIIALVLAFFLLLTSTSANIKENFWELGVLKAMGLSKSQC